MVFTCAALCEFLCKMSKFYSKMSDFLFSAYFGVIIVTIAMVKIKLIPDFYTLANYNVLLNLSEVFGDKQFFLPHMRGGGE